MNTVARRIRSDSLTPLADHPRWLAACEKIRSLEERYARSKERERINRARLRSSVSVMRTTSNADLTADTLRRAADEEKAAALAAGRELAIALPPQADLDAALEEQRLLTGLLVRARSEREEVQIELDAEASRQLAGELRATYGPMLRALEDLHRAHRAWCDVLGRLQGAGYRLNANVAPVYALPHAAVLGDPGRPETIAGRFRTWLKGLS